MPMPLRFVAYRILLLAYPRTYRAECADEIVHTLRCAEAEILRLGSFGSLARFWGRECVAVVRMGMRLRRANSRIVGRGRRAGARGRLAMRLATVGQDARFALRTLKREPGWAAAAIGTLALAIGATTAIFSVVNTVLLRPLPFAEPDRLFVLEFGPANEAAREWWEQDDYLRAHRAAHTTFPNYEVWRDATADVVAQSGIYDDAWQYSVNFGEGAVRLPGTLVSASLLQLLGTPPVLGSLFAAEVDRPGAPDAVILSHRLWQEQLGGRPDVIGTVVNIREEPHTVVGVMPSGFAFPNASTALWLPLARASRGSGSWNYEVVARPRDELSPAQARARLRDRTITVTSRDEAQHRVGATLLPLHAHLVGDVRPVLLIFMAAATAVLLIACVNVVNLMAARATTRQGERVVRAALGAGRARLAQQALVESTVVSAMGAVAGLGLAHLLVDTLVTLSPTPLPRGEQIGLDVGTLLFTAGLALVLGIVVGLAPALLARRTDLVRGLNAGSLRASPGVAHGRLRDGLVVAQVALTLMMLVAAGLLIRSFVGMLRVENGIDSRGVLALETSLPGSRYEGFAERRQFYDELLAQLGAFPGVESVGLTTYLPATDQFHWWDLEVENYSLTSGEELEAEAKQVTPEYFFTLGTPLLRGRVFDVRDGTAGQNSVIVGESFAHRYWPGVEAVGRRLRASGEPWLTVVGVVGDMRYRGDQRAAPQIYLPYAGGTYRGSMALLLRTTLDPAELSLPVRRLIATMDPEVGVFDVRPLEDRLWASVSEPRFRMLLLACLGLMALALSSVGVYGVMAYAVAQRTREMGIRKALGASPSHVVRHVLRRGLTLTAAGLAVGLVGANVASGALEGYLFDLGAHDPVAAGGSISLLAAAALLACLVPALRAARVDPVEAIRAD